MRKGYIYLIENVVNGKKYVGKTTENPRKYWNMHKSRAINGQKKVLYSAMRKYGVENFRFSILEEYTEETYEKINDILCRREKELIRQLNTITPNGYNVTEGGEGLAGMVFSEEHREKIRRARLGKKRPDYVIAKLRRPKTEEHKAKLRKPKTEEHKAKLRKPRSEEYKKKMSELFKGKRSGTNNAFYGKSHTEETKDLLRKKNKEYQNRPEIKLENKLKQPHRVSVAMIDPATNKVIREFLSLREAATWIKENTKYSGDPSTISRAIDSGKKSYGFLWARTCGRCND